MFDLETITIPCPRLDVAENGLAALVRLSNGDMRKALNILQVHLRFLIKISLCMYHTKYDI